MIGLDWIELYAWIVSECVRYTCSSASYGQHQTSRMKDSIRASVFDALTCGSERVTRHEASAYGPQVLAVLEYFCQPEPLGLPEQETIFE